jgi:ubiquinone/menaquinone biosynthesis C-methylase UbiE
MKVGFGMHVNGRGLPLNAAKWLDTHHRSKIEEREQMIRDLQLRKGSFIIDAGCGPGLWTPLLARAIGPGGRILGVDVSAEVLVTAQQYSKNKWYRQQVQYELAPLEQLPTQPGKADVIFSANVSQYLPRPVATFAAMGPYLKHGGRLVIKDIDFGTMRFSNIEPDLQARVLQARERWERVRIARGYSVEDSWIGSKLPDYLHAAGYKNVQVKGYLIQRHYPLSNDFRSYLHGIAEWFVCEDAPYLCDEDATRWLQCFLEGIHCVLDRETFVSEETEFVVSGTWNALPPWGC